MVEVVEICKYAHDFLSLNLPSRLWCLAAVWDFMGQQEEVECPLEDMESQEQSLEGSFQFL